MSNRISQLPIEVVILSSAGISARISQEVIEVAVTPTLNYARLDQLPIEIAVLSNVPIDARIDQLVIEVAVLELAFTEKTQFFIIT